MKKVIFLIAPMMIFSFGFSQQNSDSTKSIHSSFGFNLGLNQSALWNSNKTDELTIQNALGFRLGVTSSFGNTKGWSLDPKAELSFNFANIIENNEKYRVDPNNLDFMLHVKYNYKGYNKRVKPYSYLGPSLRLPLKPELLEGVYDTKASLGLDFAFGVDLDLGYFTMSPELRFSGGLTDIRRNPSGAMLRGSNAAFVLNFSSK